MNTGSDACGRQIVLQLIAFGNTRVLCTASVDDGVPSWRKGSGQGWITAEYAMLPRATTTRTPRERSQIGGRTQEIQRLIGRSVRAMLDDFAFGEFTVKLDCDMLQADGGTRTAAITGACVATMKAFEWMKSTGRIKTSPVKRRVSAVSVGLSVRALETSSGTSFGVSKWYGPGALAPSAMVLPVQAARTIGASMPIARRAVAAGAAGLTDSIGAMLASDAVAY